MNENKYVFFAEVYDPYTSGTSTQIMTRNILYSLNLVCKDLTFVAMISKETNKENVYNYYSQYCKRIEFCYRKKDFKNKYALLIQLLLKTCFLRFKHKKNSINSILNKNTIIISQSPNIDAAALCCSIKSRRACAKYIQFWGDPIALSLRTKKEYSFKDWPFMLVEKRLHKYADKILYGTKSLFNEQLKLFPEIKNKTNSIDVCHSPEISNFGLQKSKGNIKVFGYFGNYYSNIRNIKPLYECFCEVLNANLEICGSGDLVLKETNNIRIVERLSQDAVVEEENKIDVVVCILNNVGVQIPGKLFYQTNTDKIILVILDGPNKGFIHEELMASNRFVFCENNVSSIKNIVLQILSNKIVVDNKSKNYYSPVRIGKEFVDLTSFEKR